MLNRMLAKNRAATVARIIVTRPIVSIIRGLGIWPRLRMLCPYISVIAIEDMAARSESAVDDSDPMIMMKNTATSTPGRYSAATCGSRLLGSPSTGWMPA